AASDPSPRRWPPAKPWVHVAPRTVSSCGSSARGTTLGRYEFGRTYRDPPRALLPQLDDPWCSHTHGLTLWVCAVGWDRALLPQLGTGRCCRSCERTPQLGLE